MTNFLRINLLFAFLSAGFSFTQNWQHLGGPEGRITNDLFFTKNGRLLCSTPDGLFYSDDYGSSWNMNLSASSFNEIYEFFQRRNGEILAVTQKGLTKSTDNGESWILVYPHYYLRFIEIAESPNGTLFYAHDSTLYKSSDNGKDWNVQWRADDWINDIAVNDSGWIFVVGRNMRLLRSTDNGSYFAPYLTTFIEKGDEVREIMMTNSAGMYMYIDGYSGKKIIYVQGISAKTLVSSFWSELILLGITFKDELVYKNGSYIYIYDPVTKTSTKLPQANFIKDQFAREVAIYNNHWIADFKPEGLYHSTDEGESWTFLNKGRGMKYVSSLCITNLGRIVAGTADYAFWGNIFESIDDGKTWVREPGFLDPIFWSIDMLQTGEMIASGIYGIYIGNGSARNWVSMGLDRVYSIYIDDDGKIYAGSGDKGIYLSINNGRNWKEINNGLPPLSFAGMGEGLNNRIFASSFYEGTYYIDSGAVTWTKTGPVGSSDLCIYDFKVYNDTIYAATEQGVYLSSNNGLSWRNFSMHYNSRKLLITPGGDIIAATSGNGVYRYLRSKAKWLAYNTGMEQRSITSLKFDKYYRLYAASDSGIFRSDEYLSQSLQAIYPNRITVNTINVELIWNRVPSVDSYHLQIASDKYFNNIVYDDKQVFDTSFIVKNLYRGTAYYWRVGASLNFGSYYSDTAFFVINFPVYLGLRHNYPNPFNSSTTIIIDVPGKSHISLKIYNILGEVADVLEDGELDAGTYKYIWEPKNLPSTLYILYLESGVNVLTHKLMLVK